MHYPYQISSLEGYQEAWKKSVEDPEGFWGEVASHFQWKKPWDMVLDWNFKEPSVQWFKGAQLNITENCIDRHLADKANQPAIIWEPNDPNDHHRMLTYAQLHTKVNQFANVLKNNGVKKSAQSIADRLQDANAEFIITCDGAFRGAKDIPLKNVIDDALISCKFVKRVIVYTHTRSAVSMIKGRDVWWEDEVRKVETAGNPDCPAETMDADDPLFILYTSGSTGKPKGVVHTCGGYMVYTNYTFVNVFQYKPQEIHFCTADIGWITGHSYIVYGPLSAGATSLMFEGIPTFPDAGRFWDIIDKFKVNILYTAPTAIRSLMAFGLGPLQNKDLSSLRVLGTVGEPINEEAWQWYDEHVGKRKCPIVDTWWQTETGGVLISNLAGITPSKPSYATLPMPGVQPLLVDEKGVEITDNNVTGNLCIKSPWPATLRTTYGDHERCRTNYFATYENLYFTGDGAYRDENGFYRITGRVDDVLNVSGHRIGTAEVENAINMHAGVVESAVVGYPHDVKGQGIYAFVIYSGTHGDEDMTRRDITATVSRIIGPIAKPDKIQLVSGLPKTRSGKIMRRILRKIAENELDNIGDTSTLLDPAVVEEIKRGKV